ncbi:MAG: hypothetical protein V7L23_30165 [Nostoc sp.]|uniref:hypothetical protein n=1 Tax=Nostoc sp. TaxID=1180 RepID=UPI002FEFDDFA
MKCIVYQVDPNALATGIPVEMLDKKNLQVIETAVAKQPSHPGQFQNTKHLYQSDFPLEPTKSDLAIPVIEVSDLIYQRILKGKMVKFSNGEIGKIYRITNKENGNFVTRQIYQLGEYRYLKRVV